MSEEKYFNFPIQLLEGFLDDSRKCLNAISDYAIYSHSLNLELDDELNNFKSSAKWFNLTYPNYLKGYKSGEMVYESIPEKSVMVGINLTIWWDYYKNDKTEFDKVCLLGFLAFKSILQDKPYCKVTNKYWLSRMNGKASAHEIEDLPANLLKFSNEYQLKKIKTALQHEWYLIEYGRYTRGFYISFKLTLEKLVFEAEKRKKSTKDKQLKNAKHQAYLNAINKLHK